MTYRDNGWIIHKYDIYFSDAKYSTKWKFEQILERLLALIFGLSIFFNSILKAVKVTLRIGDWV